MRSSTKLGIGLIVLSLAAAPLTNDLRFGENREHVHKEAALAPSAMVPTERTGPEECRDGEAAGFACDGVDLLSFVPIGEMFAENTDVLTGGGLSDIWGWTDSVTGNEYVLFGKTNGTAIYDVTDPTDPVYKGEIPNPSPAQLIWHDIKINDDFAFVVSETPGHGVQVFDLRKLRAYGEAPVQPFVLTPDSQYQVDGTAHNIVINEDTDYAYIVGSGQVLGFGSACTTADDRKSTTDNAGLHAIDIRNPLVPRYDGCYAADGYIHDAHCAVYTGPDAEHRGKEICLTSNEDSVSVVDVTDKTAMRLLSAATADNGQYPGVGYSHQGWMSEDQAWYFHGDELDELADEGNVKTRTLVYDIADLDDMRLSFINEPGGVNIDHNMYTRDGMLFQSNYTAGLQVFDTTKVGQGKLPMLASFDTYPDDDATTFNGTWSNYPYFASGTIAVTGIGEGLFLLRLQDHVAPKLTPGVAAGKVKGGPRG